MSRHEFWFHHGGVSVPDLDAAVTWYHDVLGFEVEARFPLPQVPCEIAMLRNGNLRMEVFGVPNAQPLPEDRRVPDRDLKTHGNKHVSFAVANVESFGAELKVRGADIVWIRRMAHGANIFIRDCAGNLIEFVEMPRPEAPVSAL
jgi:methylmalonyl-CoA/ethylmalonyl-CoA epimerase